MVIARLQGPPDTVRFSILGFAVLPGVSNLRSACVLTAVQSHKLNIKQMVTEPAPWDMTQ